MKRAKLEEFRQVAYKCLGRAQDATFELTDAILLTRNAYSLADLSLSPVFRRKWPSIYEALQDCRPQRQKLMQLYIKQMPKQGRLLLAGDHTAWSRPEAVTLQERTIEHSTISIGGNKPITIGQGYSTIAWIPKDSGSWALPLRHERSFQLGKADTEGNMVTNTVRLLKFSCQEWTWGQGDKVTRGKKEVYKSYGWLLNCPPSRDRSPASSTSRVNLLSEPY